MAKITIGEFEFKTKKEAQELYRNILNNTEIDTPLEGENFDYVMALLLNHPNVNEKIGNQVLKSIIVSKGKYESNRCFHLIREDGTVEDFSIGKCINGEHNNFRKFSIAARNVVEDAILKYKIDYFNNNEDNDKKVKCNITKELITKDEAHVDHREPFTFSSIVHFYIKARNIDLNNVEYTNEQQYGNIFKDFNLAEDFQKWHKENAKLRIVSKSKNLSKAYLGRIAKTKADGIL